MKYFSIEPKQGEAVFANVAHQITLLVYTSLSSKMRYLWLIIVYTTSLRCSQYWWVLLAFEARARYYMLRQTLTSLEPTLTF